MYPQVCRACMGCKAAYVGVAEGGAEAPSSGTAGWETGVDTACEEESAPSSLRACLAGVLPGPVGVTGVSAADRPRDSLSLLASYYSLLSTASTAGRSSPSQWPPRYSTRDG